MLTILAIILSSIINRIWNVNLELMVDNYDYWHPNLELMVNSYDY